MQKRAKCYCKNKKLPAAAAERERLIERYGGNPLALKIVAPTIADLFGGEIAAFLEQGELIFGSVRYLLQEQFARLSAVEESIMLWLAILREPVTVQQLANVLVNPLPGAQVLEALDTLRGRSLIERGQVKGSFTLQSVVLEYTTTRLIEAAVNEIERGHLHLLIDHGLELANGKEYIREAQVRLIVTPLLARLHSSFPEPSAIKARLLALLEPLRGQSDEYQGYAPANLLALLRALRGDLSGLDLHQLSIRNADLRGVNLHDTSLAEATLRDAVFTTVSDTIWSMAFSRNGTYWAGGDQARTSADMVVHETTIAAHLESASQRGNRRCVQPGRAVPCHGQLGWCYQDVECSKRHSALDKSRSGCNHGIGIFTRWTRPRQRRDRWSNSHLGCGKRCIAPNSERTYGSGVLCCLESEWRNSGQCGT